MLHMRTHVHFPFSQTSLDDTYTQKLGLVLASLYCLRMRAHLFRFVSGHTTFDRAGSVVPPLAWSHASLTVRVWDTQLSAE